MSIDDVASAFGRRGYGPLLVVPALIGASPIGAIPTVPTLLAIVVVLLAAQIVFGASSFWLPAVIGKRNVSSHKLGSATEKLRGTTRRLDRWFGNRLTSLTEGLFVRIAALGCMILALLVPPLELLPFAALVPFSAILLFGIALSVKDGVLMLVATALAAGAIGYAAMELPSLMA